MSAARPAAWPAAARLPALPPVLVLAFLCALMAAAVLRMPPAWLPAAIAVSLAPGEAIELGRAELAAPGAADQALRLRRDAAGRWWAAGLPGSRLVLERGERRARSGSMALHAGSRFQLGARAYLVGAAGAGHLVLADGVHAWRFDGATLLRDGQAQPACPGTAAGARLLAWWRRTAPALAPAQPVRLGGSLDCGNRIGNPDAAAGSATIVFDEGRPILAAGPGRLPLLARIDGLPRDLALAELPLEGVTALSVARTRLRIDAHGETLRLSPGGRVALHAQARVGLPPGVAWEWTRRDPWALPAGGAWWWACMAAAAGALAGALAWRARSGGGTRPALACGLGAALAVLGLGLLLAARLGGAPGVAVSLLPACVALAYALACAGRGAARAVTGWAVLLLATGLLLQLELGTGAPDTAWMRHFQKTAAAATLGLGLLGAWTCRPGHARPGPARVEAALLALAAAAGGALLVQVGWGDETGVFDLQPVEFAKLALAALSAHCIALGLGRDAARADFLRRWLRPVAPALLFAALLALSLVRVDDYSPLLLLLVWAAAMLLAWSCAARRRGGALAVAALACAGVAGLVLLRAGTPLDTQTWHFYGERFGAWLDPAAHPHTGAQVLLGAQAIGAGGWFGIDGMFGLAALGHGAAAALAIPAVQDDFAPAFLLARHGLAAGLALWLLQALFLWALLRAALAAWRAGTLARNYHDAWRGRFRCFLLCGGGAFVLGHFLLSWGTNLAFFPVMGQPMSFLSAGGSHLLFFIFPLLAVAAAGEPTFEEN